MELKLASDKVLQIQDTLAKLDEIVALVSAFTMDEDKQTLVTGIVQNIEDIKLIVDSADEMDIIVADLIKGSYLGNRKIDIDLSLNKATETSIVSYRQVDIVLVNGTKLEIPFLSGGSVLELTSHNDIRNYIVNHASWSTIEYTEFTVEEATTLSPTLMRFRDADGHSSNVERVELHVYSGTAKDIKPIYFWAQTTSALQTVANRVGDIIALGNDMDNVVELAQRIDELNELQTQLVPLLAIYANLSEILLSDDNATTASQKALEAAQSQAECAQALINATAQAVVAAAKATEATARANEIKGITTQTATGAAGTLAQVSYNPVDGKFSFVIPQGLKGDRGEAFSVNAMGTLAQRSGYDAQPINFSYFATDVSLIYFKNSATSADWSTGIPFGKGDKGDIGLTGNGIATIVRISGTGAAGTTDTYRITYTSGGTFDFNVYNGTQSDVDKAYVDAHKNNTSNPHAVTKAQVGLGSVDNTSDADKPLSDDAIAAFELKADKSDTYTKVQTDTLIASVSSAIEQTTTPILGLIWNATDDTYKRIGKNINTLTIDGFNEFSSWRSVTAERQNDSDTVSASPLTAWLDTSANLPFGGMKRYVISNTGTEVKAYNANSFSHADQTGVTATQQVMVKIPSFHYVQAKIVDGGKTCHLYAVAKEAFTLDALTELGFSTPTVTMWNPTSGVSSGTVASNVISSALHPAFITHAGATLAQRYYGAFNSVSGRSICGTSVRPTASITLATARSQNQGFGTGFTQLDFFLESAKNILALIERGSNYFERGGTSLGNKWEGNSGTYVAQTSYDQDNGLTLPLLNKTGVILNGSNQTIANSYRGIENYHSALWRWVDGVSLSSNVVYLAKPKATFTDGNITTPYFSTGYTVPNGANASYIADFGAGSFIPTVLGGSASTKVTDAAWAGSTALYVGGYLNNASTGGLRTWLSINAASASDWNIVSRSGF